MSLLSIGGIILAAMILISCLAPHDPHGIGGLAHPYGEIILLLAVLLGGTILYCFCCLKVEIMQRDGEDPANSD